MQQNKKVVKQEKTDFNDKKKKSNFVVRLFSTFVLLALLAVYCTSGILFNCLQEKNIKFIDGLAYLSMIFSIAIIIVCGYEVNKALGFKEKNLFIVILLFDIVIFLLPTYRMEYNFGFYASKDWNFGKYSLLYIWVPVAVFFIFCLVFGLVDKKIGIKKAVIAFLTNIIISYAYKGFTLMMLSLSGTSGQFSYLTEIWLWVIVIFADTFAYLGGSRFGKTKLAPSISPKKTWEGAYIGLGSSMGFGIIVALVLHFCYAKLQPFAGPISRIDHEWLQILMLILFSVIFPIISLFGDLYFSWIKRYVNIKDYSNLIPGHGGMIDRMDSFTFVNAAAFLIIGFIH